MCCVEDVNAHDDHAANIFSELHWQIDRLMDARGDRAANIFANATRANATGPPPRK